MKNDAVQKLTISMEDNTSFAYVPHPVVPHENSDFKSKAEIRIGTNSQVIISEIITCGRKHYGELFKLRRFQNLTEIYHKNKLSATLKMSTIYLRITLSFASKKLTAKLSISAAALN